MNINSSTDIKTNSNKQHFQPKSTGNDGLILQIHNTTRINNKPQRIRFIYASFNKGGHILATLDHTGNIFLVDLLQNKFWTLPTVNSSNIIKFSNYNSLEILVATTGGLIKIINSENGEVTGELLGHHESVTDLTFSQDDFMCLSVSKCEAIVWDLRSNSKVQVLNVEPQAILKHVLFMPVTSNILACFEDDTILIWKYRTFEVFKQILPASWNKQTLKSIAFTRNGRAMVFSGHAAQLTVFMLDTWSVTNTIVLPDVIHSVKKIEFVPQLFDGGCNRILALLSNNGVLHFYDMEQNVVLNKIIRPPVEIIKFDCSLDGKHLVCILSSGEVNVYKIAGYIPSHDKLEPKPVKSGSTFGKKSSSFVQKKLEETLDKNKLLSILKEFGQYPDSYRIKIWTQLLELPNNKRHYNAFINNFNASRSSYDHLIKDYPLQNKLALKNLKKLLSNLVTWCPSFAEVTYLPVFVFPFVKVFKNEPVLCFEAVCTIILNWCQYWFEYFPLPPMNILAMIENLLLEHDPMLLKYFVYNNVTSKTYVWPLLEAAFSEVLTPTDWCKLWDHILTNEPGFMLMVVVAYNILNRHVLLAMNSQAQFETFYHNQNLIDVKRLISKAYFLLNHTQDKNQPGLYLEGLKKLEVAKTYPNFDGFPKVVIDFELSHLRAERNKMEAQEITITKQKNVEQTENEALQQQEEEKARLQELEKACKQRISEERARVKEQRKRLVDLHRQLHQEELDILNKSREKIIEKNVKQRRLILEKILDEVEENCEAEELEVIKAESDLIKHYSELLRHKIHLEEALNVDDPTINTDSNSEWNVLKKHQQLLVDELQKIQDKTKSGLHLKHLNVATGIAAMDDLIIRIETELARQMGERYETASKQHSNMKILRLEAETKELETEVSKLLGLLANLKSHETKEKLINLQEAMASSSKKGTRSTSSHFLRQQKTGAYKEKVGHIEALTNDFGKLQKLIREARDGYAARPSSPNINGYGDAASSEELAFINLN